MVGLGMASAIVGLFFLCFPGVATALFAICAGIAIIILAALILVEGLFLESDGVSKWGVFIIGTLSILIGIIVIADPSLLIIATGLVLGLFVILFGAVEIFVAYSIVEDLMVRLVLAILGIVAILIGGVIVLNPAAGIETVALLTGIYLVVLGMMRIAHGINERHEEQTMVVKRL